MSDQQKLRASIQSKFDELKRTSAKNPEFKARRESLKGLIKQSNYHYKTDIRLVEVEQYPSVYELREVLK